MHLAEFWFNTNYHTSTKFTPYEALYGCPPPRQLDYILSTTKVEAVDHLLRTRPEVLSLLKQNLFTAQSRMKLQANQHRLDRSSEVRDSVYLRLEPYKQLTLRSKGFNKFSSRYYRPFHVLQRLGSVAYRLDLPSNYLLHPVFHVSCLKKHLGGSSHSHSHSTSIDSDGFVHPEPIAILQPALNNFVLG